MRAITACFLATMVVYVGAIIAMPGNPVPMGIIALLAMLTILLVIVPALDRQ